MQQKLLSLFPAYTHPLTLVSDPDRLLSGEGIGIELARRGFELISETDSVMLRYRVEQLRPFSHQRPVIIITTGKLEDLPYDLYQPGYRLTLSLHQYFPNLAYPILQMLNPEQLEILEYCVPPVGTLGQRQTITYLLREVFGADVDRLGLPSALIAWLNDHHQNQSTLPDPFLLYLVDQLKQYPVYREWDINLLVRDSRAFAEFVQSQWQEAVKKIINVDQIGETRTEYPLHFERDPLMQNLLPVLVRSGIIQPLRIAERSLVPAWATYGVTRVDGRLDRYTMLLEEIQFQVQKMKSDPQSMLGWKGWKQFASTWAELCCYHDQVDLTIPEAQKLSFDRLLSDVDILFSSWLKNNYTSLGAQRLPLPHHVHHIPHYLAYLRDLGQVERLVLVVLDGLSLVDWQTARQVLTDRHAAWKIKTDYLLAQVPTITSISRHALISGFRPSENSLNTSHETSESRAWVNFWGWENVDESICKLMPLSYDRRIDQLPELLDPRIHFWCLIDDTPDKLAHKAALGSIDQQSSLRLWLDPNQNQNSIPLENLIDSFLDRNYSVFIASDHGHVEATGSGAPSEGLLAQTRGKRARIYQDKAAALRVQETYPNTVLWHGDGILPDHMAALMPEDRKAFAPPGQVVVTHGGLTIDEVVVPFIQITKANR